MFKGIIILFFLLTLLIHSLAQKYAYSQGKSINNQFVLPDLFHRYTSPSNLDGSDILLIINDILPVLIVAYFIALCLKYNKPKIFYKFLFCISIMYCLRALFFSITTLPDPSKRCNPYGLFGACNDLVFSGHIAILTITLLFIHKFFHPSKFWFIFMIIYLTLTSIIIIKNRNHYSLDIILAFIMSYLIYYRFKNIKIE